MALTRLRRTTPRKRAVAEGIFQGVRGAGREFLGRRAAEETARQKAAADLAERERELEDIELEAESERALQELKGRQRLEELAIQFPEGRFARPPRGKTDAELRIEAQRQTAEASKLFVPTEERPVFDDAAEFIKIYNRLKGEQAGVPVTDEVTPEEEPGFFEKFLGSPLGQLPLRLAGTQLPEEQQAATALGGGAFPRAAAAGVSLGRILGGEGATPLPQALGTTPAVAAPPPLPPGVGTAPAGAPTPPPLPPATQLPPRPARVSTSPAAVTLDAVADPDLKAKIARLRELGRPDAEILLQLQARDLIE